MQLLQWLPVFVLGLLASAEQQAQPKELEIKTTYAPSDCSVKAQKGDAIKVHYVRFSSPSRGVLYVDVRLINSLPSRTHADRKAIIQWQ